MRIDSMCYFYDFVLGPNPPALMKATGRGSDSIDITWTNPSSGVAVQFSILCIPYSNLSEPQHTSILYNDRFTSYDLTVKAATPGDTYLVVIVSHSGEQRSDPLTDTAFLGGFIRLWLYSVSPLSL